MVSYLRPARFRGALLVSISLLSLVMLLPALVFASPVTIIYPEDGADNTTPEEFYGTADDWTGEGIAEVNCYLYYRDDGGNAIRWCWENQSWMEAPDQFVKTADGTTEWSITSGLPSSWPSGYTFYFRAQATDGAENQSELAGVTFTPDDETPPTVAITSPAHEQTIHEPLDLISGTAADEGSGIDYVEICLYSGYDSGYWHWAEGIWGDLDHSKIWRVADGTTDWQIASGFPSIMPDGGYRIRARAVDQAGNVTPTPHPYADFTIENADTTAPTVTITYPEDGADNMRPERFDGTADDGDGVGVAEVRCWLFYSDDGGNVIRWCWENQTWMGDPDQSVKTAEGTTNWSITSGLPNSWPSGNTFRFGVQARDRADNRSESAYTSFTPDDETPPTVAITSPAHEQTIHKPLDLISGTAADGGSGVDYVKVQLRYYEEGYGYWHWDEGTWGSLDESKVWRVADGTTDWQITSGLPAITPDGEYRIIVRAFDAAGNEAGDVAYFTIANADTTPPTATITYPEDGADNMRPERFDGTADDGDGVGVAEVRCYLYYRDDAGNAIRWCWENQMWMGDPDQSMRTADGTTEWSITSGLPSSWPSGNTFLFGVQARDRADNRSELARVTFTPDDETPPTVAITYPEDEQTIHEPLDLISGTAADEGSGIDYVEVYIGRGGGYGYWRWDEGIWGDADDSIWRRADGTTDWEITSGLPAITPDGTYLIRARAVDLAGNVTPWPYSRAYFTIENADATQPTVTITYPEDGAEDISPERFDGTADDGDGVGVAEVSGRLLYNNSDGYLIHWCWESQSWTASPETVVKTADGTTNWSITSGLPSSWPSGRTVRFYAIAMDRAGNRQWARAVFTPDDSTSSGLELTGLRMSRIEPDEAVVNWETDLAASSEVGFGTESQESFDGYPTVAIGAGDTKYHSVLLPGLTENTTYYLRAKSVRDESTAISGEISFTTPTQDDPELTSPGDRAEDTQTLATTSPTSDDSTVRTTSEGKTSFDIGETLTLKGTLTSNGEPIAGATIQFMCNNVTAFAETGEDGVAETEIAADRLGVGANTVYLRFAGDAAYLPSRVSGEITISQNLTHSIVRGHGRFFIDGDARRPCVFYFRFNEALTAGWLNFLDYRANKRIEVSQVKSVDLSPDEKSGPEATIVCGPNDEYTLQVNAETDYFKLIEGAYEAESGHSDRDSATIVIDQGEME